MHSISNSTDAWDQKLPACSANSTPPAAGDCISTLVPILPKKKGYFKVILLLLIDSKLHVHFQHPITKKAVWYCSRYCWTRCWLLLMFPWSYGIWKGPATPWVIHTVFFYVLQRGNVLFRKNWGVKENITVVLKLLITQKGALKKTLKIIRKSEAALLSQDGLCHPTPQVFLAVSDLMLIPQGPPPTLKSGPALHIPVYQRKKTNPNTRKLEWQQKEQWNQQKYFPKWSCSSSQKHWGCVQSQSWE